MANNIVLIPCSKRKLNRKAKAKDLYLRPLLKKSLQYAKSLDPDAIFILSAKHHLLQLSKVIEPYNVYISDKSGKEKKIWAKKVIQQLEKRYDLKKDHFTILAGECYRQYLIPHIYKVEIPMQGLGIGKQLGWLTDKLWINNYCGQIHDCFNNLQRYNFPFDENTMPKNGIYILFEKGEEAHGTNRIVRIGTHRGQEQLPSRVYEHFLNQNKDRSIFRKNIGRALLNKAKDPFLKQWDIDLTAKKVKEKYAKNIDFKKQEKIEKKVSQYIQSNFNFVVFRVDSKDERLKLESKIISTVSLCTECEASEKWLGLHSPKPKIRQSGLWLEQGLWKTPLSIRDMKRLDAETSSA